jgi:uncharacterized protein (DUF885 family)
MNVLIAVRNDPAQGFSSREELLLYVTDLLVNKINPAAKNVLPDKYVTDENLHVDVKPVPPGGGAFAYYKAKPPLSNTSDTNATYYINLEKLENFKRFELMSLSLHEANPGHHLHFSFLRSSNLSKFLKARIGTQFGEMPSGSPFYTSMIEGWALYAEYLGQASNIKTYMALQ